MWYGMHAPMRDHKQEGLIPGLQRLASLQHHPSWSWALTAGNLSFHQPARTAQCVFSKLSLTDGALRIKTHCLPILVPWGPAMPDTTLGDRYPLTAWFTRTSLRSGSMGLAQRTYLLGNPDSKFGWASFDEEPLSFDRFLCCAVSKTVAVDGTVDGINVLYIRPKGSSFVRIGMGEVIDHEQLYQSPMLEVCIT